MVMRKYNKPVNRLHKYNNNQYYRIIGINLLYFEIIKIKIDTKIYFNYYYRSQSKSKPKAKVSLQNSLSNFKSLSKFYPETLLEECPLIPPQPRLSEWPSRSI